MNVAEDATAVDEAEERRASIQQLWSDGDYPRVGELFEPVSAEVVARLDLRGRRVLDAATGTGNTAIRAAQAGGEVSAFDLTPALLAVAADRAAQAGVQVRFVEGDLLDIPFPDGAFDVVLSTFGAYVVDDARACAQELARVCRPGGVIVLTAWDERGTFATLWQVLRERHPDLFEGMPDRRVWSDLDSLATLFAGSDVEIDVERATTWFRFPSAAAALTLFEEASAPVQRLRDAVREHGGDWAGLRGEIEQRWSQLARPADGAVELPGHYTVATIRRR